MATQVCPELTNIQDEDVLRKMWQETEDFGRKKEIRARMYKLREQRLKDFYTVGEPQPQSEVSLRKTKSHTESIGDQGSFLTMKTKEIRDSESPTRDVTTRQQTWTTYADDKSQTRSDGGDIVQVTRNPAETTKTLESSTIISGRTSSQNVAQSSSVRTSTVSSQAVRQTSESQVQTRGSSEVTTGQTSSLRSNLVTGSDVKQITADTQSSSSLVEGSTSRIVSSDSRTRGGETVTTTRTQKQTGSAGPEEVVTTVVTTYTTSGDSQPPVERTSVRVVKSDNRIGSKQSDRDLSSVVETRTIVSEPQITETVSESISRNQQVQQSQTSSSSSYSTRSVASSVQKSTSVEQHGQNVVSTRRLENQLNDSRNFQDNVDRQTKVVGDNIQRYVVEESSSDSAEKRFVQDARDQKVRRNEQVEITEVVSQEQDRNVKNVQRTRENIQSNEVVRENNRKEENVRKTEVEDSNRTVQRKEEQSMRTEKVRPSQDQQPPVKSTTSSTDQKILNEIQKLDSYLSTQPTPTSSVPISPQSTMDANWPVDKEFVYTDSSPHGDKVMVNGERATPVRHPSNLELPKGATDGQYLTTYQHDYSPRVSRDHDTNHQYFASTLRASPDRSSPSPSKRSSSKGSLDRSTPDRKFRGSPTRKTPDHERRLSSSSYTIERISDSRRHTSDVTERSQTLPKDSNKPKRKLSSTQSKVANKTRVSTPGASPTTSPTRVQRPRKRSTSDSDSDQSAATFNKSTSIKKSETDQTKKLSSTTRTRGSSASINVTVNESRSVTSPSPTRLPVRENTPDYSSEGSITRELRTTKTIEKSNLFDTSPERSAFAPIKTFRTTPEKKDQSLNMIDEERKHILQTTRSSNVETAQNFTDEKSSTTDLRSLVMEPSQYHSPDPNNVRTSIHKVVNTLYDEREQFVRQETDDNKPKHTTPASSPERNITKDEPYSGSPSNYEKRKRDGKSKTPGSSPDRKSKTPVSSPDRKSKTPVGSPDRKTKTPVSSPDRKSKTPVSSPDRKSKTPVSSPDRKSKTPVSSPDRKSKTPIRSPDRHLRTHISSPDRFSPTKREHKNSETHSPAKPRYQSPITTKGQDYARPKVSSVVSEKTSVAKRTTKISEGDRITRRSSIPRAETKNNSKPTREPENKVRPSFGRETTSSAARVSTTRSSVSPTPFQPKTSVTRSVERTSVSHIRDAKFSTPKKPETTGLKKPSTTKPGQLSPTKSYPNDSIKPNNKTPVGSRREFSVRSADTVKKDSLTRTTHTTRMEKDTKLATRTQNKEIVPTVAKDTTKRKLQQQTSLDKESSDSIEDEQPPEFFDDLDDTRDDTDRMSTVRHTNDSSEFKLHETDRTMTNTCDIKVSEKKVIDTKVTRVITDDSTDFISAEQVSTTRSTKPIKDSPPKRKPEPATPKKSKPKMKTPTGFKAPDDGPSSSSSDEEEVIIKYDESSDTKERDTRRVKVTKRDVTQTTDKKDTLNVHMQIPKSSRESSPEKSIPISVTSDGRQTPRYADFVTEPEDVEVFDSSNLGPNHPIPSTVLETNRFLEESDDSSREQEKVSVAERVSKYIEKTNKVDIVTLDTSREQTIDSDVSKTKELFETITKHQTDDTLNQERRGSKKFSGVDDFILQESIENRRLDTSTTDTVDTQDIVIKKELVSQQSPKVQKSTPKKQPSTDDVLKKTERRMSEHAPDIESKKAFFENKFKDVSTKETPKAESLPTEEEPELPVSPNEHKVPHYMKDTATTVTRKESIQREFAPVRQGTETDLTISSKEKRSSIDVEKMEEFIRSEAYQVSKDSKTPVAQPISVRDVIGKRRSSTEVQEIDTFKRSEAYIVCEDRSVNLLDKTNSVDILKNASTKNINKEPSANKRKPFPADSPETSPTRKADRNKPIDRVPLKKKDTNIMNEEHTVETKTGKFGVTLRKTSSTNSGSIPSAPKPKSSQPEFVLPEPLPQIEEIFDILILEVLLTRAILYEDRRRIRAQMRVVKKNLESEQKHQPVRRPHYNTKSERGVKEETHTRKEVDKSVHAVRKHTPSPPKDVSSAHRTVDVKPSTIHSVRTYVTPDKKYSVKETKTETRKVSATSPERRTTTTVETVTRKTTPYPTTTPQTKSSSTYESRVESRTQYGRSSPERKTVREEQTSKTGTYTRRKTEETDRTNTFTRSPKSSPERKTSETRKTSLTKTTTRSSPERKISKEQQSRTYTTKSEERRTSDVRRTSKTSPERKISVEQDTKTTFDSRTNSRSSPDRKLSLETMDTLRSSSQIMRTSTQYTTTTSVGRKGEDSITSSYGVGPTDDQGRPLFGLRALRSSNRTSDEASDIEVGEDVGDGLAQNIRGSDNRPLFGLKALKTTTSTSSTTTVTTSEMPSTQHLVQKHQQFLSEVKRSEEKVKSEVPRAKLRDSFILDSDEPPTSPCVPSLSHPQTISLKSIIQKHEDMATTGKNVRREVESTKTVSSCHGTMSSDGNLSLTKHIVHGELRGKDGKEPSGRITSTEYTYRSSDDPAHKPRITSSTTTTQIGSSHLTSSGEVKIEELTDRDSRRDSLVSSARKSLETKQREESEQSHQTEQRKSLVRGDSIKALQHKFQQPTGGVNQISQKPSYPKAGLILRSNSLTQPDEPNNMSSSMKRISGEEVRRSSVEVRRSSVEERRSSVKEERRDSTTKLMSKSSLISSKDGSTIRDGSKSVTSFLDDSSKVTGVQDILQRMRNADLVTESSDTTEDSEARSLLNKFLGASVILQGMEAGGAGPASSALVSQVERQRILTSTQRKTDDIDEITDEKQLQILLEACSDYEQRRKIRARLRKIMAERKGVQGELVGGEEREDRREEFSQSSQISSGTVTNTQVHKTSTTSSSRLTKANSVQQSPFAKFRQLERQNSAPSGGALFKLTDPKLVRSASTIKDRLLCWARAQTSGYKNVQIDNFSTSWSSGLAFCALIHHFYPDAFDYDSLTPESRRHNFELAFRIAEEKGDIYPLLDVDDMVAMRKPDWKCVFTYVQSIYRRMHNQPNAVKSF